MPEHQLPRPSNRVLVLFGATGDLAARKLFPGFFHLYREGLMPDDFRIIGSGRHSPGSGDEFREHVRHALEQHGRGELDEHWDAFAGRLRFVVSSAEDGHDLAEAITDAEAEIDAEGERLVYLSVPPNAMQDMVVMLGKTGIADHCSLVVEKPFGHDLESARRLNATLHEVLDEEAIYRIDHFLGKEAAQNILVARFANGIFEPVWNRDHVAYVQIDVPENLDIQGRADFYEETGAFRDMVRRRRRPRGLRATAARRDAPRAPAVHALGADRAAVGGMRAADRAPAEARAVCQGLVGAAGRPGAPRPGRLAAAQRRSVNGPGARPTWWPRVSPWAASPADTACRCRAARRHTPPAGRASRA